MSDLLSFQEKLGATLMMREAREAADRITLQGSQDAYLYRRIGEKLRALGPRSVVTCARGSSGHAATYLRYLVEVELGVLGASLSPSVSSIYGKQQDLSGCVFIAISQSGRSPDLLAATRSAKASGAYVLALVNVEDSPLAALADDTLPLRAGPELSVAATKSFLCTLAASLRLVSEWTQDEGLRRDVELIPQKLRESWDHRWDALGAALLSAQHLIVLGRGVGLAVAQEAALKFKETCGLHAEAFSSAEFRHGPMALLQHDIAVLQLGQRDASEPATRELAEQLSADGHRVFLAGIQASGPHSLPLAEASAALVPLLCAQAAYQLAAALAVARGLDPDKPPLLRKVTETI
ncbi:SIS domain-containing protein [Paucibacter sp. DJ2R-2]|uniref:SIS domain-containing protein n=1 Tax=Paucibacter sp. DJ2R-2 TaxID=2893558 RepID=UPI0021E40615|nr:SIS domain-containing protein [Paucibacter sp. DJ2R-2]MCV2438606.1 SIS domain-containing protein [Paucibacter sp. DJ2R-2]